MLKNFVKDMKKHLLFFIFVHLKDTLGLQKQFMTKLEHIAVAGNIGAGKTTLSELLSRHYKWEVLYEDTNTNPYLSDFYNDMQRWSFNLQIYFLNSRYRQIIDIRKGKRLLFKTEPSTKMPISLHLIFMIWD